MFLRRICIVILLLTIGVVLRAQLLRIDGKVLDAETGDPIEFASVLLTESGQWAISDDKGHYTIKNVPAGRHTLTVQCLGYQKRTFPMELNRDISDMRLRMKPENLKLSEVMVTARRKTDEATTSYTIDRQTLDQQQILNLSDLKTLLPGGKTVNSTLLDDSRFSLRSGSQEKGNASFGTAIEIDGMRLDNNAATDETTGVSTRSLGASNIESVEIVTGIPSVEYGDLSNGIVKVNTRRGKSPFIIEGKINQHTRQIAVNKGFDLGPSSGMLNASVEHAQSFANAVSPYTAYQRNILSLNYQNTFLRASTPLTLNASLSANIGGYNSRRDPDQDLDDYSKVSDNALRASIDFQWLLNKTWLTNLRASASFAYSDRKTENYDNANSASTAAYIHTTSEGYFMAEDYDANPTAPIVLGPTGYWYVRSYHDSKPLSWNVKLKADQNRRLARSANRLTAGLQYSGSRNEGRGKYYENPRLTPTWREYRYDRLPTMHNVGLYIEEKVSVPTGRRSTFELTAGLRDDITMIGGSDYGTVQSLAPRLNSRHIFWRTQRQRWVSSLEVHAGWGKSVKLPSFQVLYPTPSYSDLPVFAATSDATNKSYQAFHTYPSTARYNPGLRWQYTHQTDLGIEAVIKGTRVELSAFYHRTSRAYMSVNIYNPFSYFYTSPVNSTSIAAEDRRFSINQTTGEVTMSDAAGTVAPTVLSSTQRHTYTVNRTYVNASTPIHRYGLEWIIDFAKIQPLQTSLRLDGCFTYYKGIDEMLFASQPGGITMTADPQQPYQYVGYYRGSNATEAGNSASASVTNGSMSRQLNLNATITTHIPRIRMIVALRIESSLYSYRRALSEQADGTRGYMLANADDLGGAPYDGTKDRFVVVYPEYYSTWDAPTVRIPFAEQFLWAKDNDPVLYSDLSKLVVRSNYAYTLNPDRLSAYYSANFSVTKEIGEHVSISFYANNFFRNMSKVHSSQTGLKTSLFDSSYIPGFYYGLCLRLKL